MVVSFRCDGQLYNQHYAWIPCKMTSGSWVWLTAYYARETKREGWVTLTPLEFLFDSPEE